MAVGEPPVDAIEYVPHGLWMPAQWEGLELRAAAVEIIILIAGLASRNMYVAAVLIVVVLGWHVVFRAEGENDPHSLEISMATRSIGNLDNIPAHSTFETPTNHFPKPMLQ